MRWKAVTDIEFSKANLVQESKFFIKSYILIFKKGRKKSRTLLKYAGFVQNVTFQNVGPCGTLNQALLNEMWRATSHKVTQMWTALHNHKTKMQRAFSHLLIEMLKFIFLLLNEKRRAILHRLIKMQSCFTLTNQNAESYFTLTNQNEER